MKFRLKQTSCAICDPNLSTFFFPFHSLGSKHKGTSIQRKETEAWSSQMPWAGRRQSPRGLCPRAWPPKPMMWRGSLAAPLMRTVAKTSRSCGDPRSRLWRAPVRAGVGIQMRTPVAHGSLPEVVGVGGPREGAGLRCGRPHCTGARSSRLGEPLSLSGSQLSFLYNGLSWADLQELPEHL